MLENLEVELFNYLNNMPFIVSYIAGLLSFLLNV